MNSMGLLAILVWLVIPVVSGWMVTALARRQTDLTRKRLAITGGIALLIAPWIISSTVKWFYDQKVLELCAKDGGIKVYETVILPPEKFNQWGQPVFHIPTRPYQKLQDSDQYYIEWKISYLKQGNPNLVRNHFALFRLVDRKMLGESVSYTRSGGELPGPWHGSSFHCPEISKVSPTLRTSVFITKGAE